MARSRMTPLTQLEQYTLKRPQEVLLVTASVEGELDQVLIFKGFSSSLVRSTAFDPDMPVLPADAEILNIDVLVGPYDPGKPRYIQQGLTWETIQPRLQTVGLSLPS
ncbi:hypothetical protein ACN4EK_28670 [Pantanalinema rosaneae CENA516]|uniref:DUF7734 family protein n=1 Tax=Pantanalinema rosaneae TaxID=1620701 RepID=UPI003D6F7FA4